jgi:hypothetical protein
MKTLETLNTKQVDILLRFAMSNCVSHANKPSNGYGHWKTARGKDLDGSLEWTELFDDGRRFGLRTEPQ